MLHLLLSFLLQNNMPLWIKHVLFIHSSGGRHLGAFCILAMVCLTAMNVCVSFVWTHVLISLVCMPGNEIAKS